MSMKTAGFAAKCAAPFVALLVWAGVALAQTPTATLVGRITDSSKAGIPEVSVKVRNLDTNDLRTVQSHGDGEYTIANLEPGFYEITLEKSGFKQARESRLELQVGQTARF